MEDEIIKFTRERNYRKIRDLVQGGCGRTVLLYDDMLEEHFVCKKFHPLNEDSRQELFDNFKREIKLLHIVYHPNVVRVFNYYLYPSKSAGYIVMEHIDGHELGTYLSEFPNSINDLFIQAVSGFRHLEENKILHRDIAPRNLMVTRSGSLKIIDLGFGKEAQRPEDFDKSVNVNWYGSLPAEFAINRYDFTTEVYFLGKLFERCIQENSIEVFEFTDLLKKMCMHKPDDRIQSFDAVGQEVNSIRLQGTEFGYDELTRYREFADSVASSCWRIESSARYQNDIDQLILSLEDAHRSCMLDEWVEGSSLVLESLVIGQYECYNTQFSVPFIKAFIKLLKDSPREKQRIILSNLHRRLDAIVRYDKDDVVQHNIVANGDDDLPF